MTMHKGFTLVEALIAVTIIIAAVVGPLTSASRAVVAAQGASLQLVASQLAQEGVEYVRAMRDHEYLQAYALGIPDTSDTAWDNFLNGDPVTYIGSVAQCRTDVDPSNRCVLDPARDMGSALFVGNAPLYLDSTTHRYTQESNGTEETPFTRTVYVEGTGDEVRVVSTVSWDFHGTPYSITTSVRLTPWQ